MSALLYKFLSKAKPGQATEYIFYLCYLLNVSVETFFKYPWESKKIYELLSYQNQAIGQCMPVFELLSGELDSRDDFYKGVHKASKKIKANTPQTGL